jgi:hypothetical protein
LKKALTKIIVFLFTLLPLLASGFQPVSAQSSEVKSHVAKIKGQTFWLKIDLVEVNFGFRGTDAANVLENGEVSYRATVGGIRQTQSQSAEDFAEEARLALAKSDNPFAGVRVIQRGSVVKIRKAQAKKKEVYIELDKLSGARHAVHLKVNINDYSIAEVDRLFEIAFAKEESELKGADETVSIELGMSVDDIIALKGKPKTKINLGTKTIITYEDLKLIFKEGKLVDVE